MPLETSDDDYFYTWAESHNEIFNLADDVWECYNTEHFSIKAVAELPEATREFLFNELRSLMRKIGAHLKENHVDIEVE